MVEEIHCVICLTNGESKLRTHRIEFLGAYLKRLVCQTDRRDLAFTCEERWLTDGRQKRIGFHERKSLAAARRFFAFTRTTTITLTTKRKNKEKRKVDQAVAMKMKEKEVEG